MAATRTSVSRVLQWTVATAAIVATASCSREPLAPIEGYADSARRAEEWVQSVRVMEPRDIGVSNPASLAFSRGTGLLLVASRAPGAPAGTSTDLELVTLSESSEGTIRIEASISDPVNMTFDARSDRLLILQPSGLLTEFRSGPGGGLVTDDPQQIDTRGWNLRTPRGLAVDPTTGVLFVLDAEGPQLVRVEPHPRLGLERPTVVRVDLPELGAHARGLALNPSDGHLHVLDRGSRSLYELTPAGRIVAVRDLSGMGLENPQGMTFAPSGDRTDDPAEMSLYVADAGLGAEAPRGASASLVESGYIAELSLTPPVYSASGGAADGVATLIRTVRTYQFNPPSPDPAGITYLGNLNQLLISDSEVNEMSIYKGANLFRTTLVGGLQQTYNTLAYSDEPTGIDWNPNNGHLFISDDTGSRSVYEVTLSGGLISYFGTGAFGSGDPEGVTYDTWNNVLFIVDGVNREIYRVAPGPNGLFDGSDDVVTHFDTQSLGLDDPEGIAFDTDYGHLYAIGKPSNLLFHITTSGALIRTIDVGAGNMTKPAGLAYAPSSTNPSQKSIYIVARGTDNDSNPNENDGMYYEYGLPPLAGANAQPVVTITAPSGGSTFSEGESITFSGTATDAEDGNLTSSLQWTSSMNGNIGTGGSFSTSGLSIGTHEITASVTDSQNQLSEQMITLTVNPEGFNFIEMRVVASSGDAEEASTGSMDLTSSDLELVQENSTQKVGIRFAGLTIPKGATITNASIQFKVDEVSTGATSLSIHAQASDNAPAFSGSSGDITARTPASNSVAWNPPDWPTIGDSGPDQRTPNIAPVIQQIVSRSGWASGNAIVILITGSGKRTAESYDGDAAGAPMLHVDYTVGPVTTPSASQSTVVASPTSITAGGETSTITVTARDAGGNPVAGATVVLAASGSGNTLTQPAAVTDAAGQATGTISSTATGNKTVSATINGTVSVTQTATVSVGAGAVNAGMSLVSASPTSITAGGQTTTITVTARDAGGNPVQGATVVLAASGGGNTLTQPVGVTNAAGQATGTLSSTVAGSKTVSATINGTVNVTQTATVSVGAGAANAGMSQVSASPTSIAAGGETSTITVTARDANGNPIQGASVVLAASGGGNTLTQPVGVTNAAGQATGTLSCRRKRVTRPYRRRSTRRSASRRRRRCRSARVARARASPRWSRLRRRSRRTARRARSR